MELVMGLYIWHISPRCAQIYNVTVTSNFSNLVPVFLDYDQISSIRWQTVEWLSVTTHLGKFLYTFKGMEHVPIIFMSFDKYLFLEVLNILI